MKNEIGRKITSLTIMTIMIAGGMTFAVPGMVPAAHAANANLFVSAESSQFDNYMSGPQVIEVVIIDSDINDTDELKGEPEVTVNGKILRMVQTVDGNWYGYFADNSKAEIADATTTVSGEGLDFGSICTKTEAEALIGPTFTNTTQVAIPYDTCTGIFDDSNNVVREAKAVNENVTPEGQIDITVDTWPFIQLYNLSVGGNVVVQYNKGGGTQTSTLTFDTVDQFAKLELDSPIVQNGTNVLLTITDLWLNIDPTDEDSWTFGTVGTNSTNYQVFDENGNQAGDGVGGVFDISPVLDGLMCTVNCVLTINPDIENTGFVVTLQDNDDSEIRSNLGSSQLPTSWETLGNAISGNVPITITERGPNSSIFDSYDELEKSNIVITDNPSIGSTASVSYNASTETIFASLTGNLVIFRAGSSGINCPPTCLNIAGLTILPNEGVTWFNADIAIHEVVSGTPEGGPDGLFDSGFIIPGDSFSLIFETGGTFPFYDIIHPWVTGVVTVLDLTPPTDTDIVISLNGHKIDCQDSVDCYEPASLSIEPGTEVKWFNADVIDHTVTSGTPGGGPDGLFDSETLQPGQQFVHTFLETGTFPYFDTLHTWAIGEIIVNPVFPPGIDILISLGSSSSDCQFTDDCFIPSEFIANIGDTVTWLNLDDAAHTVTSGTPGGGPDGLFDSGLIFTTEEFSNQFLEGGIFPYYDVIHPWAVGSITVNPQDCLVPSTGNWVITQNCKLISSATAPANVIVQNNSVLTIPSGVTLTIPSGSNITIESGGEVLIRNGGTLQIIS